MIMVLHVPLCERPHTVSLSRDLIVTFHILQAKKSLFQTFFALFFS